MIIKSRAPVRVDFAGAWTDVPYFSDAFGGATCNAAIKQYVRGELDAYEENQIPAEGLKPEAKHGGNLTGKTGLSVHYESEIPAGSGLGTSATLNVVWLSLVRRTPVTGVEDKMKIAALACDIEKVLGIIGGKQDQYASAVGGINLFEFGEEVKRVPVEMKPEDIEELQRRLVLCYTGKPRLSSNIHKNVWGRFRAGDEQTTQALFTLRDSAYQAKACLEDGAIEELGKLLTVQFEAMKALDSSTSNAQIGELFELAEPMIIGGKPCGAGGGGCLLFLGRSAEEARRLREKIGEIGLTVLDLEFDFEGLCLEVEAG